VPDDNPWVTDAWLSLNKEKLRELPIGLYSERRHSNIPQQSHIILPALILNNMGGGNVLDFGGGTGFSYFAVSGYINKPSALKWYVIDPNKKLHVLGCEHLRLREAFSVVDNITFEDRLPDVNIDLINISSTLQYIEDVYGLLSNLSQKYKPLYFVLTRTLSGNTPSFVSRQIVHGKFTPCRFMNISELKVFMQNLGYEEILNAPGGSIDASQYENIAAENQITCAVDLVYKKVA